MLAIIPIPGFAILALHSFFAKPDFGTFPSKVSFFSEDFVFGPRAFFVDVFFFDALPNLPDVMAADAADNAKTSTTSAGDGPSRQLSGGQTSAVACACSDPKCWELGTAGCRAVAAARINHQGFDGAQPIQQKPSCIVPLASWWSASTASGGMRHTSIPQWCRRHRLGTLTQLCAGEHHILLRTRRRGN